MELDQINRRISAIDNYIGREGYSSYDPYDGLSSSLGKWLLGKNQLLSRILQQAVRLFPFNIRPIIGVKKMVHTKAISDFASGYCLLYKFTKAEEYREKAVQTLNILADINLPTKSGLGWGLRFPFATRFVKANASKANIFQTINAIHSFLDGYESLGDPGYLKKAEQGFMFLERDLGYTETEETISWKYWENLEVEIHNVNGLMIGLSARMWVFTQKTNYRIYAQKLFNCIKQNQNPDGSWHYAADDKGKFIDGFHTGYILEGIIRGILSGAIEKNDTLDKGIKFYLTNFFTEDRTPRYFPTSTFPIDGQNAAQALQTLYFILNVNFAEKSYLISCFERIDQLLWNPNGYYNYKKTNLLTYKTPMHRWVTGPMFLALSHLKSLS